VKPVWKKAVTCGHWHQRTSNIGGPSLSFFPLRLPSLPLSPPPFPLPPLPLNSARGYGERCELPQRVWAEPGRQMHFGAFGGKNEAFQGTDFL